MPAPDRPPDDLSHDDRPDDLHDIAPDDLPPQDDLPDEALDTGDYAIAYDDPHDDTPYDDDPSPDVDRPPLWVRWWARRHWAIYLAAFLTPLIVLGTLFALLLALEGDEDATAPGNAAAPLGTDTALTFASPTASADPNLTPEWPTNINFTPHTTPARIRHTFSVPGEHHGYQFEGHAGDVWIITVEPYQRSGTDPMVTLYGPEGTRICQNADCAGDSRSEIVVALNADGTYRVVVTSASGISTGYYLLTLDDG